MKLSRLFLFCAAVAIAAACSSGSSTGVVPQPTASNGGQGSTPKLDRSVTFTVDVPAAASPPPAASAAPRTQGGARRESTTVYLSPNTGSIQIRLVAVNGVSLAQPPPAAPASNVPPSCRGSATGCKVSVPNVVAAVGTDTYTVTTFAGANAEGAVISTGVISLTVTSSGTVATIGGDPTELALGGYVATLGVSVAPSTFRFGVPGKATVVVTPRDAAGATIVGNAQFAFPIVVSVTGSGFGLSGQGLEPDGTIQLTLPQTSPIVLAYDGTGTGAVVNASSQNGAGVTVTAPPVTIGVPTPTPSPTSSAMTTLPPLSPSPTGSGPTSNPSAVPSSVYALNAYDNTVFEFGAPVNGKYSEFPRRGFGGTTPAACGTPYALLGIATDPGADVYVGSPSTVFGTCSLHIYTFPPTFSGPGAPPPVPVTVPGNEADAVFGLSFDAPNGGRLDFSDDSLSIFIARVPTGGGKANPTLGYPVKQSAFGACFVSSGLPSPDPTCGNGPAGTNAYFDEFVNFQRTPPFTVGPDGSLYLVAYDEYTNPLQNPLFGNGAPAILRVTPPNQISAGTITAEAQWIEGPSTMMSFPVALAYDAAKNSLWVYDAGNSTNNNGSPSTPPPNAGPGTYLMEFPLSAFGGVPGPQNIAPTAFLSGQTVGRFATASDPNGPLNLVTIQPNALSIGNGTVFVANQLGPFDGVLSTPPPAPYNGEIDAYSDSVTGINPNTVGPFAIYYGSTLRGPIAISFGPHGAATGYGNLQHAPPNLPSLRARFAALQRRNVLDQRRHARQVLHPPRRR